MQIYRIFDDLIDETTMNNESPKAAANRKKYALVRSAFKGWAHKCMICSNREVVDVHEIANGPARQEALGKREAWLAVCRMCHDQLSDKNMWPVARQLAVKLVKDPEWFDPVVVNILRGRDPEAITLVEIAEYLKVK